MGTSIEFNGIDILDIDLGNVANDLDELFEEVINTAMDIVEPEQRNNAMTMIHGPYWQGVVANAIKQSPVKDSKNGKTAFIEFEGSVRDHYHKKPYRIASIAYMNEYGVPSHPHQPARPFIQQANETTLADVLYESARCLDDYLKRHNL